MMRPLRMPVILALALAGGAASAQTEPIVITKCLAVGPVTRGGRYAIHQDAVEAQVVAGTWRAPKAGDTVSLPGGRSVTWAELSTDKDGWFQGRALTGGYAYAEVVSDREQILLLEAQGHSLVYVNGVPRTGDPYAYGYVRLPVVLRRGANDLLFSVGRGRLKARLVPPAATASIDASDATLPDLIRGQKANTWGVVVIINASTEWLKGGFLECSGTGLRSTRTAVPAVPPLGIRKVGFQIEGRPPAEGGALPITLRLSGTRNVPPQAPVSVSLRIREPGQTYKRTFLSGIDGSVQYYAVNPARPASGKTSHPPALVLSLHGASVEAIGQADAYASKTWAHIVCPTNRRPYGFDWEDWGRVDAMEVLDLSARELKTDPERVYLTGHSMGGHGAWQLGATFPDRFAAVGPSAGWISFYSYAGGQRVTSPTPVEEMLQRASASSDTLLMKGNYGAEGVYILHGSADDNVPPTEARAMSAELGKFHKDFAYHEQPGAGHWWSASDEPGAQCVDWPPMFDMFSRRYLPANEQVRQVDFTTVNPGVSSRYRWVSIESQVHPLQPSSVSIRYDLHKRRYVGSTTNVSRLTLDLSHMTPGEPVTIVLDGIEPDRVPPAFPWPAGEPKYTLERKDGKWWIRWIPPPVDSRKKGSHRYGPFKEAFSHRFLFVYGTKGTAEENAWALAKARYDAETFWYRGNGSVDIVSDVAFEANKERDRSVILYGNADTNAAWSGLIPTSPVVVSRTGLRVGDRQFSGGDLACVFLQPRPGSDVACVGVVAGSGAVGMRLTDRLPFFLSGAGIPDCLVLGPEVLTAGSAGIRAAGFFGEDWSVDKGEFAWQK
jgi:dienelactone hydrolase